MSKTPMKGVPVPNPWPWRAHVQGEIALWQPPLTSVDNDIAPGFALNRARSRELSMIDPHGVNASETLRDAIIGRKFTLALLPDDRALGVSADEADEWASLAEAVWKSYADSFTFDCDATRKNTFTFLMHQAQEAVHTDGEALAIVRAKEGELGYVTCLQMIEPERLDPINLQPLTNGEVRYGVERDEYGEPIAYHIYDAHPADARWSKPAAQTKARRVERSVDGRPQVLHVFDEFRPGMSRGVSRHMLAALKQMKMLSTFGDATLSKAITAANYAAVIETEMRYDQAMAVLGINGNSEQFGNNFTAAAADYLAQAATYHSALGMRYNGAKVLHLMPGEKLNVVQAKSEGVEVDAFVNLFTRKLAAALNVSYEELSRDFSNVSYAAARQSMTLIWRRYLRMREMLVTKFAMPFMSCWMQEAILTKRLPMLGREKPTEEGWKRVRHALCQGGFISWGQPTIDPVKELTGKNMGLAMGLDTARDAAAEQGLDYAAILRQRAREMKMREDLGLNVTGIDPTLVIGGSAKVGNPQEGRKARKDAPGS